jgi:hypothetical protein
VFQARPPASLGPVRPEEVKTEALGATETEQSAQVQKRPEPVKAYLDQAELSVASPDGSTRLDVQAQQAEKDGDHYRLKVGRISIHSETVDHLQLAVTDGTYIEEPGSAYIEGTMSGQIMGTDQRFLAERLRWDEKTNIVHAEAVSLSTDALVVRGERMRILLPSGVVEFEGPVTASVAGALAD